MSNVNFNQFKKEAIKRYPFTKTVPVSSLEYIGSNRLVSNGLEMEFSRGAINDLNNAIGISSDKNSGISKIGDSTTKVAMHNLILKSNSLDKKGNSKSVTLISDPNEPKIIGVSTKPLVSPETFFDVFEKVMNFDNFDIKGVYIDYQGLPSISVASNRTINFVSQDFEDFNTGLTIGVKKNTNLNLMSYLYRLICSNGAQVQTLKNEIDFENTQFYNELLMLKGSDYISPDLPEFVDKAIRTKASLSEVHQAAKMILNNTKNGINYSNIEQWNDFEKQKAKYKGLYGKNSFSGAQMSNILTDRSLWDLVNGMTDYASHEYGYIVDKVTLQTQAFEFLMRNEVDAEKILPSIVQMN